MKFSSEHIEQYLKDQLSEADKLNFESEMASNHRMRNEVDLQKDLQEVLRNQRKAQLKARLQSVDVGSANSSAKWLWMAAAAVLIVGAVGSVIYLNSEEKITSETIAGTSVSNTVIVEKADSEAVSNNQNQVVVGKTPIIAEKSDAKNNAVPARVKIQGDSPEVVVPVQQLNMDDSQGEIADNSEMSGNSVVESKSIEVKIDDSNRAKFHYQFINGKLTLFGNFNEQPYELIDLHSGNQKQVYFKFNGNYYLLEKSKTVPTAMKKVTSLALIKELEKISKR